MIYHEGTILCINTQKFIKNFAKKKSKALPEEEELRVSSSSERSETEDFKI